MSTEQYTRKLDQSKKLLTSIRKDLQYREEQEKRGETTYSLDAEIKGSFLSLDQVVERVEKMFNNYRANPKDFGFSNKELEKRQQQYEQLANQRTTLRRQYDSFFQKKPSKDLIDPQPKPTTPAYNQMNTKQLLQHKQTQQQQQDQVLDELLTVVKNTKKGNENINTELVEQDVMLDVLDKGMDENVENMGRVRRNMVKLLEGSSSLGLILGILVEIAGILCILFLWK